MTDTAPGNGQPARVRVRIPGRPGQSLRCLARPAAPRVGFAGISPAARAFRRGRGLARPRGALLLNQHACSETEALAAFSRGSPAASKAFLFLPAVVAPPLFLFQRARHTGGARLAPHGHTADGAQAARARRTAGQREGDGIAATFQVGPSGAPRPVRRGCVHVTPLRPATPRHAAPRRARGATPRPAAALRRASSCINIAQQDRMMRRQ